MFLHFPTYDSVSDYGSLSWCRIVQEETLDDFTDSGVDDLVVSFYQMDLNHTLFLLRSYLCLHLQMVSRSSEPTRVCSCVALPS